jgi:hypothetical protein
MERRAAIRTLTLAIVAAAVSLPGDTVATLNIASQNALHLSDSERSKIKRETIKAQSATFDVYLIQETMTKITMSNVTPGTHAYQWTEPKGATSYKERYVVIYNKLLTPINGTTNQTMVNYGGAKKLSRPPSGTMLKDTNGSLLWFVDFHAVFGKSVQLRRDEARDMAAVYTWFQQHTIGVESTDKVVLAGDWNLGATDQGFTAIKALNSGNMQIVPDVKTSLNRAGDLSEPYDHFVADKTKITFSQCKTIPPPSGKNQVWWRNNVSDHLGIQCVATY